MDVFVSRLQSWVDAVNEVITRLARRRFFRLDEEQEAAVVRAWELMWAGERHLRRYRQALLEDDPQRAAIECAFGEKLRERILEEMDWYMIPSMYWPRKFWKNWRALGRARGRVNQTVFLLWDWQAGPTTDVNDDGVDDGIDDGYDDALIGELLAAWDLLEEGAP